METKALTKDEVIRLLKSDPLFILGFVVDNNTPDAVSVLASNGYVMPEGTASPEDFVYNTLKMLLDTNKSKCIAIVSKIKYNKSEDAPEYTKNLLDYFSRSNPASNTSTASKFSLDALLGGLGEGLSTYSGISLSNELGTNSTSSQAQIAAANAAAEAEAKKQKTNWIIGLSVVGIIVLGVIIYVVTRPKEDKKD